MKKDIPTSDLEKIFRSNNNRLIHKCNNYFDIYERHFSRYRNTEVVILEIGVSHGGSLQMWKEYFGSKAKIYGIDVNPQCKELEEENIKIFIGSQSDKKFLRKVKSEIPKVDILIDDGGHTMRQQIVSFEEMFSHVKMDGVYLCEDLHTSYWLKFGGGHKRRGTFIEYSKNFIDYINAYHSEQRSLRVNSLTKSIDSVHFYDGMVVIEKTEKQETFTEKTGTVSFEQQVVQRSLAGKIIGETTNLMLKFINTILRFFRLSSFIWK